MKLLPIPLARCRVSALVEGTDPLCNPKKDLNHDKILSLLAGGAVCLCRHRYAGQPLQLSETQLDKVTAGGVGIANAAALALGDAFADTTQTSTNVQIVTPRIAIGQAFSQALAGSLLFRPLPLLTPIRRPRCPDVATPAASASGLRSSLRRDQ